MNKRHEYYTNKEGGTQCARCGHWKSIPDIPEYCTPNSQKDNQATSENWEEKFEKLTMHPIGEDSYGNEYNIWDVMYDFEKDDREVGIMISDFIRELLQSEKDRLKGEIEKLRKSVIKHNYGSDKEEIGIYIPYEEVLKLLK